MSLDEMSLDEMDEDEQLCADLMYLLMCGETFHVEVYTGNPIVVSSWLAGDGYIEPVSSTHRRVTQKGLDFIANYKEKEHGKN